MQNLNIWRAHRRGTGLALAGLLALSASAAWAVPGAASGQADYGRLGIAGWQSGAASSPEQAGPRALFTVGPHANCDFTSLQTAIDFAGDGDTIRVAASDGYPGLVYALHQKSLTIQGGYSSCDLSATPSGRTVLNAQGHSERLLDVWDGGNTRMRVKLENLELRGGNGGLLVEGQFGRLAVELVNVWIQGNHALTSGGGVRVRITGLTADNWTNDPILTLDNDTVLAQNSTTADGGGLFCSSGLPASQQNRTVVRFGASLVVSNSAGGNGGGVASTGCRRMWLYTGGPVAFIIPTGGVFLNSAGGLGGGLYVAGGGEMQVSGGIHMHFGLGLAPLINGNDAQSGGGAAVTGTSSLLVLQGAQVHGNSAEEVAGGILVTDHAELRMGALQISDPCKPTQSGGGQSSAGPCSRLQNNTAQQTGAALMVRNGGQARITQTRIINNQIHNPEGVASVIAVNYNTAVASEPARLVIDSSQITANKARHVAYSGNGSELEINWSTVADNEITHGMARSWATSGTENRVSLGSSIFWGNTSSTLVTRGDTGEIWMGADCVIAQVGEASSGLDSAFGYRSTDPQFLAPQDGDYRLGPTSPAIDFCDDYTSSVVSRDLGGNQRNQVWTGPTPGPNPGLGHYDLGAFEAQLGDDVIFRDGFE